MHDKLKNQIDLLHEENNNFSISYDELVLAQENLSIEINLLQEQIRELQNDEGANNTELIEQIEALEEKVEELVRAMELMLEAARESQTAEYSPWSADRES